MGALCPSAHVAPCAPCVGRCPAPWRSLRCSSEIPHGLVALDDGGAVGPFGRRRFVAFDCSLVLDGDLPVWVQLVPSVCVDPDSAQDEVTLSVEDVCVSLHDTSRIIRCLTIWTN